MAEPDDDPERSKGFLAKMRPATRFIWIVALTFILLNILIAVDPASFRQGWQSDRLALIERLMNITLMAGAMWVVIFEGDALLAAFARALRAVSLSAFAEALRRAGLSGPDIKRIITDYLAQLRAKRTRRPPADDDAEELPLASAAAPEPTAPTPGPASAATRTEQRPKTKAAPAAASRAWRVPWRTIVILAVIVAGALAAWRLLTHDASPAPGPDEPNPPREIWIRASGSISETLTTCMGRTSWEALEQSVADANGIECNRRSGELTCAVRDGQPLLLPPGSPACVEGFATYPDRAAAVDVSP